MSSPQRPSTKQTLLPDSNIRGILPQDTLNQKTFDNLIQSERLDATLNQAKYINNNTSATEHLTPLNRLPTLYEILNRRTEAPVDLWSLYVYIRDYQNAVDYLDFWIDVITHLRLCKDYVRGLRESLILSEKHRSTTDARFSSNNEKKNSTSENEESPDPRESVSSSLLLEALLNEGFLDEKDSKRVSSFLQGNEYININDARIHAIFNDQDIYPQPNFSNTQFEENPLSNPYEPLSSPKKIFSGNNTDNNDSSNRNSTRVIPEQLEKYIANVKNGNISRATLKSSSRNILNTYFKENSPKRLIIPDRIIRKIRHDIEIQGRDDPDVFDEARNYVYSAMERESLPFFLQQNALHNLNNSSSLIRLILGLFFFFAGFWISYSLIFTDVKPKAIRAVIIVPFLIGSYLLFSFLYNLDPIMVWFRLSDNQELNKNLKTKKKIWIENLYEPFVYDLLKKRSIWVLFLILLTAAAFSILFGLVPGHRI